MSSPSISPLSAGVQQLYNNGLLPSSLNNNVLNKSSAGQLNQMANTSIALQEIGALLGDPSATTDSATLSPTATLLQGLNPTSTTASSGSDALTQAVNNELTSSLNAAVSKFLPQTTPTSGSNVNLLG